MIMSPFGNVNRNLHILMYPWFALSHLTSFLLLANNLANQGLYISFFLPSNTRPKLSPHNHLPHLITFFPIIIPSVDGLPPGAETTNDVPASVLSLFATAMDLTKDTMDSYLSELRPDYVLFDFAYWMDKLARKHGAKSLYYATSSLVRFAYFRPYLPADEPKTEVELIKPPPGFPCPTMGIRAGEARCLVQVGQMEIGIGVKSTERISTSLRECDAIGSKTCREFERLYIDFLEKNTKKPHSAGGAHDTRPASVQARSPLG